MSSNENRRTQGVTATMDTTSNTASPPVNAANGTPPNDARQRKHDHLSAVHGNAQEHPATKWEDVSNDGCICADDCPANT